MAAEAAGSVVQGGREAQAHGPATTRVKREAPRVAR